MEVTFLGTGGGRFTTVEQLRRTGGFVLAHDGYTMHVDPGPGALVHANREGVDLGDLDALTVTHAHLDHDGDMRAVIEAMTRGGTDERGTLLAATSVLDGAEVPERYSAGEGTYGREIAPSLDPYHRSLLADVVAMEGGWTHDAGPFTMEALRTEHSDPATVAFALEADRRYGFVSDTELFPDLVDFFEGCDVLVVNLMRPHDREWKGHLNTADAAELLDAVEPEFAVMQHFGAALIYSGVADERDWLADRTDVDFVMAEDGMTVDLDDPRQGLDRFIG